MSRHRFVRSLVFGAVAALATAPFLLTFGPTLGRAPALALASVLATAGHLAVVAPGRARGVRVGFLALVLGLALFGSASPSTTVLGSAAILAVLRSGFLYRSRPGRALLLEGSLLAAGLAFANALAGSSVTSLALAVWGFFLVESVFFVVGGTSARPEEDLDEDPFDRARREAVRLMEEASM
jgi:hypothetical protein